MGEIINAVSDFVKDYGGLGWVIAAAALAFTVFQFLYKRRTGGVKLDVTFSNGVLTYPNGELSDPMIFLARIIFLNPQPGRVTKEKHVVRFRDLHKLFVVINSFLVMWQI